jgi:CheY-like chemotaxis protein
MARILIIEDNPTNLQLIVYLLQAFGHTALEAMDGETGLELIRLEAPELVLCDIHLPGIDGFEVAHELKRHPVYSAIPLVAVTALAMVGDRDRILSAGFDGYITKPITPETFIGQMEAFLPSTAHSSSTPPQDASL